MAHLHCRQPGGGAGGAPRRQRGRGAAAVGRLPTARLAGEPATRRTHTHSHRHADNCAARAAPCLVILCERLWVHCVGRHTRQVSTLPALSAHAHVCQSTHTHVPWMVDWVYAAVFALKAVAPAGAWDTDRRCWPAPPRPGPPHSGGCEETHLSSPPTRNSLPPTTHACALS